ncbi:MAG: twin-arginine translocase TatA/TatE family subunit [Patescibacteria group bacterium]
MFGLGAGELIILALVLVLLFGSKSVPELAKGLGELVKNFRSAFSDAANKVEDLGNQVNELNDIKEKVDKKRK